MKNKIENILLGLLWLLIATLGTTFWFNTKFGFNIFSGAHWKYLGTHQATHQHINSAFYPSMVVAVFVTLFVLYLLLRPRFRKIKLPIFSKTKTQSEPEQKTVNTADSAVQNETASTINIIAETPSPQPQTPPQINMTRPPRLAINPMTSFGPQPAPQATVAQTPTTTVATPASTQHQAAIPTSAQPTENADLNKIFSEAGYEIKKSPRIGGTQITLLAIGQNEVLWLGGVGISTYEMNRAAEQLADLFADTLDGIEIDIRPFTVYAPDNANPTNPDVLTFDSFGALREYVSARPNPPLSDEDRENFDAYSEYISTVIEYLGKM